MLFWEGKGGPRVGVYGGVRGIEGMVRSQGCGMILLGRCPGQTGVGVGGFGYFGVRGLRLRRLLALLTRLRNSF